MKLYTGDTYLMKTTIQIKLVTDIPKVDAENLINRALNEFHKVAVKYTRFNDSSELSELNRSGGKFVKVSAELFSLIKYGIQLSNFTEGLFDLTVIDVLEAYGYDKNYNFDKLKNPNLKKEIRQLLQHRPSYKRIVLDEKNMKIKLQPHQRIDLGALGKGYAIKKAKDLMLKAKAENFLINAGGDLYAHGKNLEEKPWKVSLFDPEKSLASGKFEKLKDIELENESLACSGSWARKVGKFHHLIDTRTGNPTAEKPPIFVKAKDPLVADAWATIMYLKS